MCWLSGFASTATTITTSLNTLGPWPEQLPSHVEVDVEGAEKLRSLTNNFGSGCECAQPERQPAGHNAASQHGCSDRQSQQHRLMPCFVTLILILFQKLSHKRGGPSQSSETHTGKTGSSRDMAINDKSPFRPSLPNRPQ